MPRKTIELTNGHTEVGELVQGRFDTIRSVESSIMDLWVEVAVVAKTSAKNPLRPNTRIKKKTVSVMGMKREADV